ncbi:MAG: ABC transporter permease subunit, partial [Desulfobulbus sp.]|nr:ABC transporter permease subunit [Desulfobulbus sp.]
MMEFPQGLRLPMAEWVNTAMDWILLNWGPFFDIAGKGILQMLLLIERLFLWIPWPVIVLATGIVAWRVLGRWTSGVVMALLLLVIGSFGYWQLAMMTLALVVSAVVISLVIGIPTGILMARSDRLETLIRPLLDAMQTMPSFVYLIPALMLFGLGKVPAVFATIIYA